MSTCPSCSLPRPDLVSFCVECGFATDELANQDPWCGRVIAGRFRLVAKLGAGGMGEVYEAIQDPIGRSVALKILSETLAENPGQVERFKREAQAASQLSHPNTIVVHDFGQDDDGTLFIAMEHLKGASLDDRVKSQGSPTPEWVVRILSQVCDSLQEAHDAGMVHRDLKPENIFLTQRSAATDLVKVLDFGIAKVTHSPSGDTMERLTQQGTICGTPHYMAPEQIRDMPVDHRADIYALGVLLYWLIAGREPFDAGKVVDLLTMHIKEPPPPIKIPAGDDRKVWRQLEDVARHALAKAPEDRPQSARELRDALTQALGKNIVMTSAGGVTTITTPQPRRSKLVWGLAATLAAAAALIWSLSFLDEKPRNESAPPTGQSDSDRMSALFWAEDMIDDVETPETQKPMQADAGVSADFWRVGLIGGGQTQAAQAKASPAPTKPETPATPATRFGEVRLVVSPANATVRLGNFPLPWTAAEPTIRLPVGEYVLDISAGNRSTKKRLKIRAGEIFTATVDLKQGSP